MGGAQGKVAGKGWKGKEEGGCNSIPIKTFFKKTRCLKF